MSPSNSRRRATRRHGPGPLTQIALLLLGFLSAGLGGAAAYFLPAATTTLRQTGQSQALTSRPADPSPAPGGAFTVLLLGSDDDAKFAHDRILTQSMILVRVVPASNEVTFLSIPRDLYVPLASGGSGKIDLAYYNGGAKEAIATVEKNFGVRIDEYVWIGLQGLVSLIDRVGGVDLVTSNPVLDDFYPSDLVPGGNPYGFIRVAVLPGPQHLDGLHAMEYVRSRHSDLRGDFGRSQRQQQVLLALRARAAHLNAADLPDLVSSFSGEVTTSLPLTRLRELFPLAAAGGGGARQETLLPPLTESLVLDDGEDVLIPNWGLILPLVHQTFPA